MIWLYIYLGFSALTFLLYLLTTYEASCEIKRRYPSLKTPKRLLVEYAGTLLRMILYCVFPLINISLFWILVFKSDEIQEKAINKVYMKYGDKENDI